MNRVGIGVEWENFQVEETRNAVAFKEDELGIPEIERRPLWLE